MVPCCSGTASRQINGRSWVCFMLCLKPQGNVECPSTCSSKVTPPATRCPRDGAMPHCASWPALTWERKGPHTRLGSLQPFSLASLQTRPQKTKTTSLMSRWRPTALFEPP